MWQTSSCFFRLMDVEQRRLEVIMNSRFLIFVIFLFSHLTYAQDPQAESLIADAIRLEGQADVRGALVLFKAAKEKAPKGESLWWQGALGKLRCLVKLKDWKEAQAEAAALSVLEKPGDVVLRFDTLRAQVSALDPGALEKQVKGLLSNGDVQGVVELGMDVRPILVQLCETRDARERSRFLTQAVRALFALGGDDLPAVVLQILNRRVMTDRAQLFTYMSNTPHFERGRGWEEVIRKGLEDPSSDVRSVAVSHLKFFDDLGGDLLLKMAKDRDHSVRFRTLTMVQLNFDAMKSETLGDIFEIASKDEAVNNRRWVLYNLRLIDRNGVELGNRLVESLLTDKIARNRVLAFEKFASRFPAPVVRRRLLESLTESSRDIVVQSFSLLQYNGLVRLKDIGLYVPHLSKRDDKLSGAAVDLLKSFSAAQIVTDPDNEAFLAQVLKRNVRSKALTFAISKLAIAGKKDYRREFLLLLNSTEANNRAGALYYFLRHKDLEALPQIMKVWPKLKAQDLFYVRADSKEGVQDVYGVGIAQLVRFLIENERVEDLSAMMLGMDQFPGTEGEFKDLLQGLTRLKKDWDQEVILKTINESKSSWLPPALLFHFLPQLKETSNLEDTIFGFLRGGNRHAIGQAAAALANWKGDLDLDRLVSFYWDGKITANPTKDIRAALNQRMGPYLVGLVLKEARMGSGGRMNRVLDLLKEKSNGAVIRVLMERVSSKEITDGTQVGIVLELAARELGSKSVQLLLASLKEQPSYYRSKKGYQLETKTSVRAPLQLRLIHQMGEDVFWPTLKTMLVDPEWSPKIKAELIHLAAFCRNKEAGPLILAGLKSESVEMRQRSALAASHLLMLESIDLLRALLRDPEVSSYANLGLKRFAEMGFNLN